MVCLDVIVLTRVIFWTVLIFSFLIHAKLLELVLQSNSLIRHFIDFFKAPFSHPAHGTDSCHSSTIVMLALESKSDPALYLYRQDSRQGQQLPV